MLYIGRQKTAKMLPREGFQSFAVFAHIGKGSPGQEKPFPYFLLFSFVIDCRPGHFVFAFFVSNFTL